MSHIIGINAPYEAEGAVKNITSLLDHYYGYRYVSLTGPVNRMLVSLYGHDFWNLKSDARDFDGFSKQQLQWALHDWGMQQHEKYWLYQVEKHLDIMRRFASDRIAIVITHIQYEHEAEWLRSMGGKLCHLTGVPFSENHPSQHHLTFCEGDVSLPAIDKDGLKPLVAKLVCEP